eukprot:278672-Amphidinium_carterae.2
MMSFPACYINLHLAEDCIHVSKGPCMDVRLGTVEVCPAMGALLSKSPPPSFQAPQLITPTDLHAWQLPIPSALCTTYLHLSTIRSTVSSYWILVAIS